MSDHEGDPDFDLAVSFAGEDRAYVHDVVAAVRGDLRVFYDEDNLVETWGEDLVEFFSRLYSSRTRFVVMFISRHYAEKAWPRLERRAALSKAITRRSAYVLPIRLDDTELDGLLPTVGFIDARRVGLDRLADSIRQKVGGPSPQDAPHLALPVVPTTQDQVERTITERPSWWEYGLYAGLLQINLASLEPIYRDYAIKYARPNGEHLERHELYNYCSAALARLHSITQNLEVVLDPGVQERAFGRPGEPGDPDRIVHLANRFVTVYEDLMGWAAALRSVSTTDDESKTVLRALARFTEQPVESCRDFVHDFVAQITKAPQRIAAGEKVEISFSVVFEIPDDIRDDYDRALLRVAE